jgi:hypothetical protein
MRAWFWGVSGEKVLFRDWESESTMEVMGRATMDMMKAFELFSRISRLDMVSRSLSETPTRSIGSRSSTQTIYEAFTRN